MKLMKLLLIGLLSVVALAACSEDEAATTKAAVSIVGADGQAPVLFDNVSAQLKAVDAAGEAIVAPKEVTWGQSSDAAGFAVTSAGIVTVDLSAAIVGTVTLSVKTPGDSTADPVTLDLYDNVTYAPAVSALVLKSIAVTPAGVKVAVDATTQLVATATFGEGEAAKNVVITTDAAWVSTTTTNATVDPATGLVTGVLKAAATEITASLTSNGVAVTGKENVEVTDAASATFTSFAIFQNDDTAGPVLIAKDSSAALAPLKYQETWSNETKAKTAVTAADIYTCAVKAASTSIEVASTTCVITPKGTGTTVPGDTTVVMTRTPATGTATTSEIIVTVEATR